MPRKAVPCESHGASAKVYFLHWLLRDLCYDSRHETAKFGAFIFVQRWCRNNQRQKIIRTFFQRSYYSLMAEAEGFEPPWRCRQTVFKFYFLFVFFRLLLLFNRPNYRKISVLTALLSDNPGFLLCFGIVPCSLSLLIFSTFLTAFCRDFVDCFAWIKKFICCFILFLFLTNTRRGAKQIFAYQSNQESV